MQYFDASREQRTGAARPWHSSLVNREGTFMRRLVSAPARTLLPAVLFGLLASGLPAADPVPGKTLLGKKIDAFTLPDTAGKPWSLDACKDKKAVAIVFLGTECPVNNAYLPRLVELHKAYAERGVQFVAVNANQQDTAARIAEHAKKHGIPFPVLKDEANAVADQFGATRTPEVVLLDGQGRICYRGRIDDQYGIGYKRPKPTRRDLVEAIEEVLAGKIVSQPTTPVAGCLIGRAAAPKGNTTVTYAKEVSRIVQKNCQECHRPGQIGPMALLTYDDAAAWSEMIREVVVEKRMPPWYADPKHGKFLNDRRLSDADRDTLLAWIEQGCPKGDDKDLPPAKQFAEGWRIGKPDVVFEMPDEFMVPAEAPRGGVPYQYFRVPTRFTEDRWVQFAEAKPGNSAIVHHIIVYIFDPKEGRKPSEDRVGNGFLVGYAPGDMPLVLAPGQAKKVPKGAVLMFQMHYTPNGVAQGDRSSIGLIFAKEPPKAEVRTRSIDTRGFVIPPGDGNHKVVSATRFDRDATLISFLPHMHLRGKDFEYCIVYPDGKAEVPLSVPKYDFNWQSNYYLEKPLHLPAGTRIECTAHFDNSTANPNNPNPTEAVRWGDQTWQEMMIGFVDYYYNDARK
jgi:peroxiredoxin